MWPSCVFVACLALVPVLSGALHCALPEPLLRGVRNGSVVALPVAVEVASAHPLASDIFTTSLYNGRAVTWNTAIKINKPGRHRIGMLLACATTTRGATLDSLVLMERSAPVTVAVAVALDQACERADLFVFDTYDATRPSFVNPTPLVVCVTPELHLVVFWATLRRELVQGLTRVLSALSSVTTYHDAEYPIALRRLLLADVDPRDPLDASWLRSFHGDSFGGFDADSFANQDFQRDSSFSVAVVEDLCPTHAFNLDRNELASTNMLELRSLLHDLGAHEGQVYVTVSRQASSRSFDRLFGMPGEHFVDSRFDPQLPGSTDFERGVFATPWGRVLAPIDSAIMLTAFIQTEWHHFQADVPSLHAELGARVLDLGAQSTMDTVHRAAFLGVMHIALIAHIPADTKWYNGVLDLRQLASFRVISENSWKQGSLQCLTIKDVAARMVSFHADGCTRNCDISLQSQSSHAARVHRLELFANQLLDKPIIAVSASLAGPFTILDGNHRAIALTRAEHPDARVSVFIGISSKFNAPHEGSFYCP